MLNVDMEIRLSTHISKMHSLTLFAVCVLRFGFCDVIETRTNLSAIAYDVCSVNAFCKSGSDRVPDGKYSCCNQCSCEPDCYIGQRCCPDSDAHNTKNMSSTCKHMDEHFNLHRNIHYRHGKIIDSFYAIESCSEDFYDADVIAGCLVPRTIREHVFVTDPNSMLNYKNYQCAICNGVSNYEFWNLRLECPYDDHLYNATEQEKFILDKCSFNSEPVLSSKNSSYRWACHPDAIDRCNVTGEWDLYNDALVDACSTFNVPYIAESSLSLERHIVVHSDVYKNIYCFLCNRKVGLPVTPICLLPEPPSKGTPMTRVPIETLFDISRSESIHRDQQEKECKIFEMMDSLMGCTDMLCPFGLIPVYADCLSLMESTILTVSAVFEYEVTSSRFNNVLDESPSTTTKEYQTILERIQLFFDKNKCMYCDLKLTTTVILVIARTTESCPQKKMLKLFEYMTKRSRMRIQTSNGVFDLTFWLSVKYSHEAEPGKVKLTKLPYIQDIPSEHCSAALLLAPKFYCKRMRFSMERLAGLGISTATAGRILAESEVESFVDGVAMNYVICVDRYMDIVNSEVRIVARTYMILTVPVFMLCRLY